MSIQSWYVRQFLGRTPVINDLKQIANDFADSGACRDFSDIEKEMIARGYSESDVHRAVGDTRTREELNERCRMAKLRLLGHASDEGTEVEILKLDADAQHKLTDRETNILLCLTRGESTKQIAHRLDIAEAIVKDHLKAILRKIRSGHHTQTSMSTE